MDPQVEADLATIDRALVAGRTTGDAADGGLAELALLLREERSEPAPDWAESLDQRAAAGFPRGGRRPAPEDPRSAGDGDRWSWLRKGGWMVPAGAVATLAIVVVVATNVSQSDRAEPTASDLTPLSAEPTLEGNADSSSESTAESGAAVDGTAYRAARRNGDKIAPGTKNRKVDRNAQITLSARPDDVRGVTDEVITITRSLDGIVASSQVSETDRGAEATLQLTLPTRNVDAALDRITDLADVDSLNETTEDITKPFVSARDEVKDAKAKRQELLEALGNATTDAEAQALEIRIAEARREIARAEARFDQVAREARLSDLTVRVVSDANASDERSLGDWADDALDVLRGLAGVLLIAAAILVPLALIAAIVYVIAAAIRRHRRERALD